jgi:geranylgeranyl transferase type-1 subunit beta
MTLGFFILSALDLLGAGGDTFPEEERNNIRKWILDCQHPLGGFCGSSNHKYPEKYYKDIGTGPRIVDPPNLPATFFALLSLSFVDGLQYVNQTQSLRWLKRLQRQDGSFGELVSDDGHVEGGRDMRYCYVAAAVRWILRGDEAITDGHDIDVDALVDFLKSGQVGFIAFPWFCQ